MKNEKSKITAEQITEHLNQIKINVENSCIQIGNMVENTSAFVLPINWSNGYITIQITPYKPKIMRATGKRQTIIHDDLEYPTYAMLCDHLGLSHVGNSARRVLDSNGVKYETRVTGITPTVDKTATNSDKTATDKLEV